MRAEIIAIGTELLLGQIANTNAQALGEALARIGVDCTRQVTVGDNEERIAAAVLEALPRADAVIMTGGLGPTQDDVTREAIARATGRRLRSDERAAAAIRERFAMMKREMPHTNLRQAELPDGARFINNPIGTAPGIEIEHEGRVVYALPGVPSEMMLMLDAHVVPDLVRRAGGDGHGIVSRIVRVAGLAESAVGEALAPVWDAMPAGVTIAFLAGGGEVRVRVTAKSGSPGGAFGVLDTAEEAIRGALGFAVVGAGEDTLEAVAGRLLREHGWMLAVAESLTGGMIGARITSVPGASAYFRGAIVSYATDVKVSALGVNEGLLASPVSEPVARAMAAGARSRLGAHVGLASTGVAGPTEQRAAIGTVFVCVDGPRGTRVRELRLPGSRDTVRTLAAAAALNLLRLYLLEAV